MDLNYVYDGEIPAASDPLSMQRNALKAVGSLAFAVTGGAWALDGLPCGPTQPASLAVNIGQGWIYAATVVSGAQFGELPPDLSALMKIGAYAGATMALSAPQTAGQSIVYLIQATYEEVDADFDVESFYNAANPSQPFAGPNNGGNTLPKTRRAICYLQPKPGAPAPAGTATAPGPDVGWVPAYTVTVNAGDTGITADRIAFAPGAPFLRARLTTALTATDLSPYALQSALNAEATTRNNSDVVLTTAVSTEVSQRSTADNALSARIDALPLRFANMQTYGSNSSWTAPAGCHVFKAYVTGGGGGGGGSGSVNAGGGGGAGGTAIGYVYCNPGDTFSITVGTGGNGGAAGNDGAPGGTSSVGSVVTAGGGGGGQGGNTGTAGGPGGAGYGGQLTIVGGFGGDGTPSSLNRGGDGAASYYGGGGRAATGAGTPQFGEAYGSGGGAGYFNAYVSGGPGQIGCVVIEW